MKELCTGLIVFAEGEAPGGRIKCLLKSRHILARSQCAVTVCMHLLKCRNSDGERHVLSAAVGLHSLCDSLHDSERRA